MGQTIGLKASDGFLLGGYRADPTGKPKGGLVVIQEIFGVNHHIRNVCDRFAASGYAAVAPAMFDRAKANVDLGYDKAAMDEGVKLRAAIKLEDSLKDVQAAIDALKPSGKVGVIGYCWGGSLAFLAATRLTGLACAVGYYGGMIAAHRDEKPNVPTILHFGDKDMHIPMAHVNELRQLHPDVAIFDYPADHGFHCDERGSWDAAASKQAMTRTLEFFSKHVG